MAHKAIAPKDWRVAIPFEYGISSEPHGKLLIEDEEVYVCASTNMMDSFQPCQLTAHMPSNDREDLLNGWKSKNKFPNNIKPLSTR